MSTAFPTDVVYTETHEWIRIEADGSLTVGITDFGQEQLGSLVYVALPQIGAQLTGGADAGVVESNKTASDVHAPVSGTVLSVNEVLNETPEAINAAPYVQWIFKLQPDADFDAAIFLDAAAYCAMIG
ncbi:glycine cleavage system protein GcvH [Glaciimonas sp. PAMC28666]|uniref:glycine cleavage system protein GcvH n=1 Tax=Glaciimonas sp. PAMC28666 TaxID=2807626 RepID=UPI0019669E34|nr:glycine cleavage system protein GcvH [Glaciimonas sp. PAMC28666]QRX82015.1 glycine cleavage system protein GcvH [Glaciimonas sp. PAMC28666]